MDLSFDNVKSRISARAFAQGMAVVCTLYAALLIYSLLFAQKDPQAALFEAPPHVYAVHRPVAEAPLDLADRASAPAQPETASALPAPKPSDNSLYEETPLGKLPKKAANGQTPFEAYKRPYTYQGKPVIALAVMDYGLSAQDSQGALDTLPAAISFIINPYAADLPKWQQQAAGQKRELYLLIPTEQADFPLSDPGPYGLEAHLDAAANTERLHWLLSRTQDYAGVALDADGTMANARLSFQTVMDEIFDRGLAYFDINTQAPGFFEMNALGRNAPYTRSQDVIGTGQDDTALFARLEKQARDNGSTTGLIKLQPESLKTINAWVKTLAAKGIDLAPISAVSQSRMEDPK